MHTFSRLTLAGTLLALFLLQSGRAEAGECTEGNDNLHGCWKTLSGPNYAQVAVGSTPSGVGIACAVTVSQVDSWGGVLHCFAPVGTSGAVIRGRGGEEAQNPGPFSSSDASKRIVSLAIRPLVPGPLSHIYALRSDGQLFVAAVLSWPYAEGADPRIYFSAEGSTPLSGIREIAWAPGTGLVATTQSNQRFVRNGSAWNLMSGSALLLAGNNDSSGHALYVSSTNGSTTLLGDFVGWPVTTLPGLLAAASSSFERFGHTRPLTVGANRAYALLPANCSGGSALTPCIFRAGVNTWNHSWGSWNYFPTADFSGITGTAMPWTIQDGSKMRGAAGELWVIGGAQHLKFWVP
jgi:hypothetical protein